MPAIMDALPAQNFPERVHPVIAKRMGFSKAIRRKLGPVEYCCIAQSSAEEMALTANKYSTFHRDSQLFTGIVQGVAKVKSISKSGRGADTSLVLNIGRRMARGLRVGDSVSVSGTCLTVTKVLNSGAAAEFQLVGETMRRTCLGSLRAGDSVNIERSLKVGDRLEGHFVLGHVDGVGKVSEVVRSDVETTVWVELDDIMLFRPLIIKGSIAVDGVSLTITGLDEPRRRFSVSLIPHTLEATALGLKKKGDPVNIEIDILGKHVARALEKD